MQDFDDNVIGSVKWGDGWSSAMKGKGKVVITVSDQCGGYQLTLQEVYYTPDLKETLLSER
jgi:hypothetical protein